eukprot:207339-Chlamydomonas_euryale.AAC.1
MNRRRRRLCLAAAAAALAAPRPKHEQRHRGRRRNSSGAAGAAASGELGRAALCGGLSDCSARACASRSCHSGGRGGASPHGTAAIASLLFSAATLVVPPLPPFALSAALARANRRAIALCAFGREAATCALALECTGGRLSVLGWEARGKLQGRTAVKRGSGSRAAPRTAPKRSPGRGLHGAFLCAIPAAAAAARARSGTAGAAAEGRMYRAPACRERREGLPRGSSRHAVTQSSFPSAWASVHATRPSRSSPKTYAGWSSALSSSPPRAM